MELSQLSAKLPKAEGDEPPRLYRFVSQQYPFQGEGEVTASGPSFSSKTVHLVVHFV